MTTAPLSRSSPAWSKSPDVRLVATATKLDGSSSGKVVVCGSHGGIYPGVLALEAGVRAIILHDAGVGRDAAGIASLAMLDGAGVAAATVASSSCRIGDAEDVAQRGMISFANATACALGIRVGMTVEECFPLLCQARAISPPGKSANAGEFRSKREMPGSVNVILVDSAALVEPEDRGHIVVTGSHGGLISGNPMAALQVDALAALFNDAGVGADGGGITRLPILASRGIAAVAVDADTARIGSARSTLDDGIISHLNVVAQTYGARRGMPASEFVALLLRARPEAALS